MDTIKLEAKWPPDRKTAIEASEFGIYKEPDDGKRLRGSDVATGCLLILSLIAAAAVVVYFTFFDYTIPTNQASSIGPIVSYAKYVKEKHTTTANNAAVNRSTDSLLATVLGMKNAENYTIHVPTDEVVITKRIDDKLENGRHMRLYPITSQKPIFLSYNSNYWNSKNKNENLADYTEDMYGFSRRSDFPQLAAYRAPFPPKSILDVMKYVTETPRIADMPEFMMAQESKNRYAPILPQEKNNKPVASTPKGNSKRFRNKFGPPLFLIPPVMKLPDDFMKPPSPDASFSMDFENDVPLDLTVHGSSDSISIPSHTEVVFHSSTKNSYPVPDTPTLKKHKNKKIKNNKPISVMVDIYPLIDDNHENEQDGEENQNYEIFESLKNHMQKLNKDNLLLRLNLFPKLSERNHKLLNNIKYDEQDYQEP